MQSINVAVHRRARHGWALLILYTFECTIFSNVLLPPPFLASRQPFCLYFFTNDGSSLCTKSFGSWYRIALLYLVSTLRWALVGLLVHNYRPYGQEKMVGSKINLDGAGSLYFVPFTALGSFVTWLAFLVLIFYFGFNFLSFFFFNIFLMLVAFDSGCLAARS